MMAFQEDSRPFVTLRQGAENFRSTFDENIETCAKTLDSKLSSLICDPDSFGSPSRDAQRLAANVEFSKAKFEIFMSIKALVEEMDETWKSQLTQLKNDFLENVEILLASTKLETDLNKKGTKLPSNTKHSKTQFESRSSITSSMPPFSIFNTAKKIPVLNALLPKDDELTDLVQMKNTPSTNFNNIRRSPHFSPPSRKIGFDKPPPNLNQDIDVVDISGEDEELSEEDNEAQNVIFSVTVMPSKLSGRQMKKSTADTTFATKEIPVDPLPLRRRTSETVIDKATKATSQRKIVGKETVTQEFEEENQEVSDEDIETQAAPQIRQRGRAAKKLLNTSVAEKDVPARPLSRRAATRKETVVEEPVVSSPLRRNVNKSRKSILKTEENELHTTPSRSTRKRTAIKEVIQIEDNEVVPESIENGNEITSAAPKTPKNVHFSVGLDVHDEDLDIYSPEVKLARSAPRRKTMVLSIPESFSDINLTPNVARSKSKRKTIGGSAMDVSVGPSPKRFKRGGRSSMIPDISEEPEESDLLESDELPATEHYTPWLLLNDLDGKIPAQPGIYELKVYKAKKSAYIGSCENLRQKLTLHKLGQSSGHKHLDKFLERNKNDVQVRYEKMSTAAEAKNEEMNRIKAFVELHKTTPAYN